MFALGGQAGEAGFAVDIGADLEIEFVSAEYAVGDVNFDLGVVDGCAGVVSDGEVGGAEADAAIDEGDGFGVGGGIGLGIEKRRRKDCEQRRREEDESVVS